MEVYEIENRKYSNQCFNKALSLAYDRKLYEATIFLKKSLMFYKYNYHARNLLALIFYEEGQIGELDYSMEGEKRWKNTQIWNRRSKTHHSPS